MCGINCLCFALLVTFPIFLKAAKQNFRLKREMCGGDIDLELMGGVAEIRLRTEMNNGVEFYRGSEECTWTLKTAHDHFMILKSDYFSIEKSENCISDYVQITEKGVGETTSRHCGFDPLTYITFGNVIQLQFKSDDSTEYKGFKFIIKSVKKLSDDSFCIGSILNGKNSSIMNKETSGDSCFYRIQAPKHNDITLTLKLLDFGSASCEEESIIIYEGQSTHGRPLGTICSDNDLGIQPYRASSMFIEYRNPLKVKGERFKIEYMFVEDNFVLSTTPFSVRGNDDTDGLFQENNTNSGINLCTGSKYKHNKKWAVAVCNDNLPRHVIQIEFDYFDMENSDDCIFGSLQLLAGEREETSFLNEQSCGKNKHGQTFVTMGKSLSLEIKTDESLALKNFQAKVSFVPDTECICKDNMECTRDNTEKCIHGKYCDINTCQNGGTCIQTSFEEKCYCPKGFKGDDCSQRDGEFSNKITFISAPVDRTLKRGQGHIEECLVEVPYEEEVVYSWSLQGTLINPYNNTLGFGTHPGGILQIDKFSDEMEGQYSCIATTSVETVNHTFTYTIAEDCDVRIYPGPQSEIKKPNEIALLTCRVNHRVKEVRWKKDGVYIDYNKDERIKKMANNYLLISNVQTSDAGVYQCEAEDYNGCYSSKEGKLQVVNVKSHGKYCGISIHEEGPVISSRISMGSEAQPGMHPWHVTFRTRGGVTRKYAYCGGTLISQRFVITAATCIIDFNKVFGVPFSAENVEMLLGTTDCTGTQNDGTRRTIQSFTVHPDYGDRHVYDNDIALIELDSLVEYTDDIRPICLEPADFNDRVFLEMSGSIGRVIGKVAGCGVTRRSVFPSRLRDVYIPYVDRETCLDSLGNRRHDLLTDTMFCAGSNIGKTGDSCQGDSGSGLIMATSTRWVLTGVVSWGRGCDMDENYGIYTNVGMFYDWIESVTKFNEEEMPDFIKHN